MKKLLVLLFSFFLLSSPSVFAETYSCAYMFDGEARPASFERTGSYFYVQNRKVPILYENDNVIYLTSTSPNNGSPIGSMVVVDKNKLNFVLTVLEFENSRAIIEGKCKVLK